VRRLVVAALVGIFGTVASPVAAAAPSCSDRVLADWFDNGRVDRTYPLGCYEDAVAALPPDLRDYTDAADVINRALQQAARSRPTAASPAPARAATSPGTLPLVLAGGGMALALLAAAGLEWWRRSSRGATRPR